MIAGMAKVPTFTPSQIKAIRKARKLTQEQAAALVGVTRRQWVNWEQGTRKPSGPACILIQQLKEKSI
jgi:DNA-binding transcriptional regulator YiaG